MLHFKTKTELLLDGLAARLKHIEAVANSLSPKPRPERNYKTFYKEIAFFVHEVLASIETRSLFVELVSFKQSLQKDQRFRQLLGEIEKNVVAIGVAVRSHPEYARMIVNSTIPFANPVIGLKEGLILEELVVFMETFTFAQGNDEEYLFRLAGVLGRLLTVLGSVGVSKGDEILELIDSYHEKVNQFKYHTDFRSDYHGASAARKISLIYAGLNPTLRYDGDTYEQFLLYNVSRGDVIEGEENLEVLTGNCEKVLQYIRQKLNSQLSIEAYVDRFTTYMSLYYTPDYRKNQAEVDLQLKFQEFLFHAGYYPISEAELKNGRLDTIAHSHSHAFLFELKQFGLGKTEVKDHELLKKIKAAQVQSSIYVDRLKAFPNLSRFVFVLTFTDRKVSFVNGGNQLVKDGITYIFKTIKIYGKRPSEVDTDIQLDVSELVL